MHEPTVSYQDEVVEMEAIDPLAWDAVDVKQPLQTSQSYDQSLQIESILQNVVEETHDPAVIKNDCKDVVMDYTSEFTTQEVFKTKEEMAEWLRVVSHRNGFVIVIKRSKLTESKRKPTIIYSCERGGKYRSNMKQIEGDPAKKKRKTGTKKCEFPFALTAKMENKEGWVLTVKCGVHNHPAALNLVGHSYAGRLNEREKGVLKEMTLNLVRPTSILRTLKSMDQSNLSTLRQIYNMQHKLRVLDTAGRSQMQHFLHNLSEGNYIEWHRRSGETNEVLDIFWTHPFNIALLRTFPTVLLMDATYKTNKYKLPFFEIVGETSISKTFMVAFAYLNSEKNDNCHWVLDRLKTVMGDIELPKVIVTDKEQTLMKVVETIFPKPSTKHLLCKYHICKNVEGEYKKMFLKAEDYEEFMEAFAEVMASDTENKYEEVLCGFLMRFSAWPYALDYVLCNWLKPFKDRFVDAWTNKYMHLGNKTTNRAESQHAKLERQLGSNQSNFATCFWNIHALLESTHEDILASFEKSLTIVQHEYKPEHFSELRGVISIHALDLLVKSCRHASRVSHNDETKCTCARRHTHGLPCGHEIARYQSMGRPIPLSSVHDIWKRLSVTNDTSAKDVSCVPEFNLLHKYIERADDTTRAQLLTKVRELACPETTDLLEPKAKTNNKGRPAKGKKKVDTSTKRDPSKWEYQASGQDTLSPLPLGVYVSQGRGRGKSESSQGRGQGIGKGKETPKLVRQTGYLKSFNPIMLPFIRDIIDVEPDENCGFRSIAGLMGFGEGQWARVRKNLLTELQTYSGMYKYVFQVDGRVDEVAYRLDHYSLRATSKHWFCSLEMGYLAASAYNCVLHLFGKYQSLTFLLLRVALVELKERQVIATGHVNENHFVQVYLHLDYPFPPICSAWYNHCLPVAFPWADAYQDFIHTYKALVEPQVSTNEVISLDSD